jgi:hypothetical protein
MTIYVYIRIRKDNIYSVIVDDGTERSIFRSVSYLAALNYARD